MGALDSPEIAQAAWRLAMDEREGRGDDASESLAMVPGIGAALRRRLRERNLQWVVQPAADGTLRLHDDEETRADLNNLRRSWNYGFLLRSLEELFGQAEPSRVKSTSRNAANPTTQNPIASE